MTDAAAPLGVFDSGVGGLTVARALFDTLQQVRENLGAVAPHGVRRLRAVGHTGRVAEVDDRLLGQRVEECARDREAAYPGIEDAERRRGVSHAAEWARRPRWGTPEP